MSRLRHLDGCPDEWATPSIPAVPTQIIRPGVPTLVLPGPPAPSSATVAAQAALTTLRREESQTHPIHPWFCRRSCRDVESNTNLLGPGCAGFLPPVPVENTMVSCTCLPLLWQNSLSLNWPSISKPIVGVNLKVLSSQLTLMASDQPPGQQAWAVEGEIPNGN